MSTAFQRSARSIPVCRQAGLRLAGFPAGGAERAKKAEGKIKEDGTMSGRFRNLLLSAHWLGGPRAAPRFLPSRAAMSRNALALLGFDRHHRFESPGSRHFRPEARP
ncbi:hypothetical protein [Nitratireductor soli]|uniref:hypothetical protein n=1 Tax=Nitratireductor soli TaxID=1670619 RepID=UPI0012F8B287|nr:hypothetical protein [Nitratireductor soli]